MQKNLESILVLGSTGLLGSSLVPTLESNGYSVVKHSHNLSSKSDYYADLTCRNDAFALINSIKPCVILNLVGLTNVDYCEFNPNKAYLLNCKVVENIVYWLKNSHYPCHLVQISTDHIYDGVGPHNEDQVELKNYYAFSKYAGELVAASVPSTILRTNFFGYSHCEKRQSFTDWLFRSLRDGKEIQVFDDILFSPLSIYTLSKIIGIVVMKRPIGLFNLGSQEGMSKKDFAFIFAETLKFQTKTMIRTTMDKVIFLKANRPKDMRMDCFKFEKISGIKLPKLEDEIKQTAEEYQ